MANPFSNLLQSVDVGGDKYKYYDISSIDAAQYGKY